jgi:hypothetical protein
MRIDHLEAHRSTPTGHQAVPPPTPPNVQVAPHVEARPEVVYCRACSACLIIHPPTDPDMYRCPQCGHDGPKTKSPTAQMPDEKARQRETPALVVPAELKAIADEHEKQAAEKSPLELLGVKSDSLTPAALPPQDAPIQNP